MPLRKASKWFVALYAFGGAVAVDAAAAADETDWLVDIATKAVSFGNDDRSFVGGRIGSVSAGRFTVAGAFFIRTDAEREGAGQFYEIYNPSAMGGLDFGYQRQIGAYFMVGANVFLGLAAVEHTTRELDVIAIGEEMYPLAEPGLAVSLKLFKPVWLRGGVNYAFSDDSSGIDSEARYELGLRFLW